jgi:hypothetical protein
MQRHVLNKRERARRRIDGERERRVIGAGDGAGIIGVVAADNKINAAVGFVEEVDRPSCGGREAGIRAVIREQ